MMETSAPYKSTAAGLEFLRQAMEDEPKPDSADAKANLISRVRQFLHHEEMWGPVDPAILAFLAAHMDVPAQWLQQILGETFPCLDLRKPNKEKSYKELLRDPRWQRKRLETLSAAGWKCERCEEDERPLHVHHKFYRKKSYPWEYERFELEVLCEDCHKAEHS